MSEQKTVLPTDAAARKAIPVGTGVFDYFTAALMEVAKISKMGNDQHNPGQPLHWARGKSEDHFDTMMRHAAERGTIDTDGGRHSAKMVWRALAILQKEMEDEGAPMSRGSRPAPSLNEAPPPLVFASTGQWTKADGSNKSALK
jgi:Domain of unknown function (DUF5664)